MNYETNDKIAITTLWSGLNIFAYWFICCMKTPAHEYDFVWDPTVFTLVAAMNLFFGGIWYLCIRGPW